MADVLVMRDVACAGYVAGYNTTFFAETDPGKYSLDAAANNIMKRLSFADDAARATAACSRTRRSRSSSAPPPRHRHEHHHASAALGGDLGHRRRSTTPSPAARRCSASTRSCSTAPSALWRGHEGAFATASRPAGAVCSPRASMKAAPRTRTSSRRVQHCTTTRTHTAGAPLACSHTSPCFAGSTNNATCFLGPHRIFDPFTKSFMNLIPGQGHVRRSRRSHRHRHRPHLPLTAVALAPQFGPDAIPGDARWRRGVRPL